MTRSTRLKRLTRHLGRLGHLLGPAALALGTSLALSHAPAALAQSATPASAAKELRIGYQKYGTLVILKAKGSLEKRLAPLGVAVKWTEFPAGPQLLEGLNVGSIDFGTTGEAPPIFEVPSVFRLPKGEFHATSFS